MRIPFHMPSLSGNAERYVLDVLRGGRVGRGGSYSAACEGWLGERLPGSRPLLTTSGTHALELAAVLLGVGPGDEVILPAFTYPSTANAFALRGATLVFVDIRPDTLNLDESRLEEAMTERTRVVVPVHYAGVGCAMETIAAVTARYGAVVVEDAAHALLARYRDRPLGTFGSLACLSFDATKNVTAGVGGALLVNDGALFARAELSVHSGTDRARFLRGEAGCYQWMTEGSSWRPSEINAALLLSQLEGADAIRAERRRQWAFYRDALAPLEARGRLRRPVAPPECDHNAHLFPVRVRDRDERDGLIAHLRDAGVAASFHFVPLHTSPAGLRLGRFSGEDRHTTRESERLVRLPLYPGLGDDALGYVVDALSAYFRRG